MTAANPVAPGYWLDSRPQADRSDLRSSGKTEVGQALRRNSFTHTTVLSKTRE
jgi:hypothetical protein